MEQEDLGGNIHRAPRALLYHPDNVPFHSVSKLQCLLMAKRQHKITLSITVTPCPLQHKPDVLTSAVVFQKTSPC